jgi:hypothetical protein
MYLLAICISSFENSLFDWCAHFFIGVSILWGLTFWFPCRFWILVPYQMSRWQRYSPILWAVSWVWWLFPLLFRSSLVWCRHICLLFLFDAEPFEFCLVIPYTYLFQCISYSFLEMFQTFRPYTKVFHPLWLDFGTRWNGSSFSLIHVDSLL